MVRGHESVAKVARNAETIFVPHVVMAELKYGFGFGTRREENERLLSRFVASRKVRILLPDNATTEYFVNIALYARRQGVQLSSHDIWIAALAEQWDATLLTFDRDFKHLGYKNLELQFERSQN